MAFALAVGNSIFSAVPWANKTSIFDRSPGKWPTGVRTPVVSISTRALIGIVQALTTPGSCNFSFSPPGPWISSSVL